MTRPARELAIELNAHFRHGFARETDGGVWLDDRGVAELFSRLDAQKDLAAEVRHLKDDVAELEGEAERLEGERDHLQRVIAGMGRLIEAFDNDAGIEAHDDLLAELLAVIEKAA